MATLALRDIRKSYLSFEVIKGIDLDVADREFVVFVGPSGCGKSTLLRMIAGLEEITSGDLLIDGQRVNAVGPADRGLAMVFQSYALYPHMTVRQNMGFALRMARVPKAERERKVAEAARVLQLEPYLDRRPKELSGGQRQRVAIGRAIVRNPRVFLFDEPLSNLDAALRGQMRIELSRLHEALAATMIYVTHDQVEAMTMADKIVVLQAGRVEQVGSPLELYHRPANLFVAGFIGSPRMNLLPAQLGAEAAEGVMVELRGGERLLLPRTARAMQPGQPVTLGIRPEALRPNAAGPLAGEVRMVERLGGLTLLHVALPDGQPLIVQIEGSDPTRAHTPIRLSVAADACHLFDAGGQALPALHQHPLAA
jgi:multiple sugar transport system ATP-binding protein